MKILEKLKAKQNDRYGSDSVTIAFLGDSVTQGCFECFTVSETKLSPVFDYKSAYSTRLKEMLNLLYPSVQINIINSGISGDSAIEGARRIERDVLAHNPDLVIVSYGLNDSTHGKDGLFEYQNALKEIFSKLKKRDIDTIFLTENTMNTKVSPHIKETVCINLAERFANNVQNNGVLHCYFEKAKEVCEEYQVKVCDLHKVWERLVEIGVDTTELLANKLNHPIREFHYYMAIKILETILF